MLKISTVIGARPQFIKASALSRQIKLFNENSSRIKESIIHTGQHFDNKMSDIFFRELDIPNPKYNLGIGGGTHGENTGRMIESIEKKILKESPDIAIVFGDTDSTLAASIACSKIKIPVAHIEAGLRSNNKSMPEETNRILTDHISDFLFCPTKSAVNNLKKEGITNKIIFNVGDIMFDNYLFFYNKLKKPSKINLKNNEKFIFCTIHREENTDDEEKLREIVNLFNELSKDYKILFPIHPRTFKSISKLNSTSFSKNILAINPLSMFETFWALKYCSCVITDSGGLQKEAFFAKKKCITLREETEWNELIDMEVNLLLSPFSTKKFSKINKFLNTEPTFNKKPFGKGNTAKKILSIIY